MLSKSQISFINSIHLKKFRKQHNLFIVEGHKSIAEFLQANYVLSQLFYIPEIASKVANFPQNMKHYEISSSDLNKISTLTNPNGVLALFEMPISIGIDKGILAGKFSLVLDHVQDPGNLGTIIRTADWFGIENIICSTDTADCYNPKVVQATMGSLSRVALHYTDLATWFSDNEIKTYGALLDGVSLYDCDFSSKNQEGGQSNIESSTPAGQINQNEINQFSSSNHEKNIQTGSIVYKEGLIILGNEGQGIRPEILSFIDQAITIPRFGSAESLNVAIAAALICSEIRRNMA